MSQCECLASCPFFNDKMANMPSMADLIKKQYCTGEYRDCARYIVFKAQGSGSVPQALLPTDKVSAQQIIAAG